jgi:hypothetical protein
MTPLTDDHLSQLVLALEAEQDLTRCWTSPPRLLALEPMAPDLLDTALAAGTVPWRRLGEGNPYHLLETVAIDVDETPALALVVHGWAFPPDDPDSWFGRPSQHPGRIRVRTAAIVTPDRRECSAVRLLHREVKVLSGGTGALMEAMLAVWDRARPPASARTTTVQPAYCRRDRR